MAIEIDPILPGDTIDKDGKVSRAGIEVAHRDVIHTNDFGLIVVRDHDGTGGYQDWQTYGRRDKTAVMLLPIDEMHTPDDPTVYLIEGIQYGLGRRSLEGPSSRILEAVTPFDTIQNVLTSWGFTSTHLRICGSTDSTSGRQYNVTLAVEAPLDVIRSEPTHLVHGTGVRASNRTSMPLSEAVLRAAGPGHQTDLGKPITNDLTKNLIFQAALHRGINPLAQRS